MTSRFILRLRCTPKATQGEGSASVAGRVLAGRGSKGWHQSSRSWPTEQYLAQPQTRLATLIAPRAREDPAGKYLLQCAARITISGHFAGVGCNGIEGIQAVLNHRERRLDAGMFDPQSVQTVYRLKRSPAEGCTWSVDNAGRFAAPEDAN